MQFYRKIKLWKGVRDIESYSWSPFEEPPQLVKPTIVENLLVGQFEGQDPWMSRGRM